MRVEGSHGSNLELVEGWSLSGSENVPVVCKEGLSSLPEHLNLGNHFFGRCCLTKVEVRVVWESIEEGNTGIGTRKTVETADSREPGSSSLSGPRINFELFPSHLMRLIFIISVLL